MVARQNEQRDAVLVVDDEDAIVQFVRDALEDEGYTVLTAVDGIQALQVAIESGIICKLGGAC